VQIARRRSETAQPRDRLEVPQCIQRRQVSGVFTRAFVCVHVVTFSPG